MTSIPFLKSKILGRRAKYLRIYVNVVPIPHLKAHFITVVTSLLVELIIIIERPDKFGANIGGYAKIF